MISDWILRFNNLEPKFRKKVSKSLKDILGIDEVQTYMPIMSLFFHIHNTRNSHKCITFDNRYILEKILEPVKSEDDEEYNITSNGTYKCVIFDTKNSVKYVLY